MPRVKYSATDAVYCAKFMKRMHELHTFNYTSVTSYDKVSLLFAVSSPFTYVRACVPVVHRHGRWPQFTQSAGVDADTARSDSGATFI